MGRIGKSGGECVVHAVVIPCEVGASVLVMRIPTDASNTAAHVMTAVRLLPARAIRLLTIGLTTVGNPQFKEMFAM
jgi:hypothetical protein